jgi:hypothetical protein
MGVGGRSDYRRSDGESDGGAPPERRDGRRGRSDKDAPPGNKNGAARRGEKAAIKDAPLERRDGDGRSAWSAAREGGR